MRVLVASTRPRPAADRLATIAGALAARRHDVTWIAPGPPLTPPITSLDLRSASHPERTAALLAVRVARDLLRHRPDVALLRSSPGIAATSAILRAARVPIVIDIDDHPREADGLPPEGERAVLTVAFRTAAAITAASERAARDARALSGRDVEVAREAPALPDLLPGTRAHARAALGLALDRPLLAHTGPLETEAQLTRLAEAHRHAAGVGLLVIDHGAQSAFAHAMTLSTRPSSPVLMLTPEAAPVALWAADALVWLGRPEASAAVDPLALGRRLVLGAPDAHLQAAYTGAFDAVHVPHDATPRALLDAIGRALDAERKLGPLPARAVERARAHLDRPDGVVARLESLGPRR